MLVPRFMAPRPKLKATLLITAALFGVTVALVLSDRVFWDRYFRAYTFDTFVENPFPDSARLYPQERVPGADRVSQLAKAEPANRALPVDAVEKAVEFAELTDSTSLLVSHQGIIQVEAYWKGKGANQLVYSFSMHKSVVAMLVGIAIYEGHIDGADTPLGEFLREWQNDPRGKITIRQVLHMNSGFEPMRFPKNPFSKHVRRQIGTNLAATALSFELHEEPGTVFSYNGVNPTLLVMVLERATGKRYAEYLSEKLWRPLGNEDAWVWLDREEGLARGATSLFAKPMDWLRIGNLILNKGYANGRQIVPEEWLALMATPSPTNPRYGMLMWLGQDTTSVRTLAAFEGFAALHKQPHGADDLVYFDGLGGQRVYVVPSRETVIVRTGVLAREWDDASLPNLILSAIKQPATERPEPE